MEGKYIIRIKRGKLKQARKELGAKIDKGRIFVRFMPSRDLYTSKKMATRYDTHGEAESHVDFDFEEVISA